MQKKLTLSIEEELVTFARAYSRKTGQSISGMVEGYFRGLKDQGEESSLSEKIARLYGVLSAVDLPDRNTIRLNT